MFPIAGQTARANGLIFLEGTQEYPGGIIGKKMLFFLLSNFFKNLCFYIRFFYFILDFQIEGKYSLLIITTSLAWTMDI